MDPTSFDAFTFDCYGTLIDWERGLLDALAPVLAAHGVASPGDDTLLERFARRESEVQAEPYRRYRAVLEEVLRRVGSDLGFSPTRDQLLGFGGSVGRWRPFPDTVASLQALSVHYRLAVVSNVDDDLFSGSAAQLGVDFAEVVTAQQVRSYKPAPDHFHEVLRRLDLPRKKVLHVAQSVFHDVAPAKALGLPCVWVNRRAGRAGGGATAPARATPDLEVPDLAALVAWTQASP
ncbi:MAG TPA: haloacid dehalogenase type II [Longimicrobiales bacterium]|nr:haloacid dehalogenase type II [Longimicrobiales bacterium]